MAGRPEGQPAPVDHATLAWATAASLLIAAVGLTAVVLPSAYGIDPTGVGDKLGFEPDTGASRTTAGNDTFEIRLAPNESLEFKLIMEEDDAVDYAWNTSAPVTYDLHGEPEDPDASFRSYDSGEGSAREGHLEVPFTGSHGWYWKNPTEDPLVVELRIDGVYEVEGLR